MKTELTKVETLIPTFTGFYHSIWYNPDMEYELFHNDSSYINDEYGIDMSEDEYMNHIIDCIDYKQYKEDICEQIASIWEDELKSKDLIESLSFDNIHSPKYYNYSTDKIYVTIEANEDNILKADNLFRKHRDEFDEAIAETFTSYSGFISFHSNDIDSKEWNKWYEDEYKFIWVLWKILEFEYGLDMSDMALYDLVNDTHLCLYADYEKLIERVLEERSENEQP